MCGIAGFLGGSYHEAEAICSKMVEKLHHRGPDDKGIWLDRTSGITIGHARLSIQDLSPAGHQPMHSSCGQYVLAFNGEIYNHLELRTQIDAYRNGWQWKGHSDTETLLAGITCWGVEETIKRSVGMFAIALWDIGKRRLYLARDRLGEKPLYYGWQGSTFLFASELKSLHAHPAFASEINRDVLCLFLRHNAIPAPYSIYNGISKLTPGSILVLNQDKKEPVIRSYWSVIKAAESGTHTQFSGNDDDAISCLEKHLSRSIQGQMLADVPLGAFLSGGIDSSLIVALMQSQSTRAVKTFTIGFNEDSFNEAKHARKVANHLKTEHTELYVTSSDAREVIPMLPGIFDEPFADSSQIPTYLVSNMAREHITVALSGDGGDELFGGYNRHFWARPIWNRMKYFPLPIRNMVASILTSLTPATWDGAFQTLDKIIPHRYRVNHPGDKLYKLADILTQNSPEGIYRNLVSHWKKPESIVIGGQEPATLLTDEQKWGHIPDFEHIMMLLDTMTYLPDDILTKVDRAAMSVSLETRVPLLDHRLVEFAWSLPLGMKIRDGKGKWALRELLSRFVPRELFERPKMGFGIPIDRWLCTSLRDWAESLLDESRLRQEGFFDPAPVRARWEEHLSGKGNWQYYLWDILMFQAWLESDR